ncbi:MAG: GGDEF domain-containing protein [Chromatiaceae bacterium]|nr:MAG: GGDEF domain-containing protein [Chromatiaceae bacterium]
MNNNDLPAAPGPWTAAGDPGPWQDDLLSLLSNSLALAVGRFRLTGEVLWLNRGMHALLGGEQPDRPRGDYLVNPGLARLSSSAGDGLVFSGCLSVGDSDRDTRSLRAQVFRRGGELLIVAEFDIAELQGLQRERTGTAQKITDLQRDLLRKHAAMPRTLADAERPLHTLRDSSGEDLGVAVYNDIGQQLAALQQARFMAEHDALTGLPNRVLLFDRLHAALTNAAARGHLVAVLMIDLDGFKPINDQHGHAVGDSVLRIVARRLERSVRSTDTVARLGGDEFVLVLRDLPTAAPAYQARRQIKARLQAPLRLKGLHLRVGASIGLAFGRAGDEPPEDLLACADAAMYLEKRAHLAASRGR